MSKKKFLINTLESTEKHEFDKIVKIYLREVHGYSRIILTDGKDDIGLDLKVFDLNEQKIQYQLTTQKSKSKGERRSFENKLNDDIGKALLNHKEYGYSNSLFFFYSQKLTNKAIREYEKNALNKEINLTLIEANRIAEESLDFMQLQKSIIEANSINVLTDNNEIFEEEKSLVFDLVGFGISSDFKLQIVEAFVLQLLFKEGELTPEEITEKCRIEFREKQNDVFYNKMLSRLQTNKQIIKPKEKTHFELTENEEEKISRLLSQQKIDEKLFIDGIISLLKEYELEKYSKAIIFLLKRIYVDNFGSTLNNSVARVTALDVGNISKEFINFINSKIHDEIKSKELAVKLLQFSKEDRFLQKFCASKVFSEKTNINAIQSYINKKKKVFIDTQISLYSLCYYYNPKSKSKSYFFNTCKSLIRLAKNNNIKLYLPNRYLWETRNHIVEAFNLVPFTKLPQFDKLGRSRNVFMNFYLDERPDSTKLISFQEFLEKFGFKQYDRYKKHNDILQSHLIKLGIHVQEIDTQYDISERSDWFIWELAKSNKFKSKFTLENDAIIFEYLSDNDVEIHPKHPMFLTWDRSYFNVQKRYFESNIHASRWFMLTPSKFIDQYSLLQFNIESESLTNELIALLSDDIITTTYSLIDSLTTILNPEDELGLEYTTRLAEIRDYEIHQLSEEKHIPKDEIAGEAIIDDMFYKLTKHFKERDKNEDEGENFNAFKRLFTINTLIEDIISIIQETINNSYENNKFDKTVFAKFDQLIEKNL